MEALRLAVDPAWGVGLLLAMTRVAAFVVASPLLGIAWPLSGRLAAVVAVSLFLAEPVAGIGDVGPLVVAALTNVTVGVALGVLTSLLVHLLTVAGALIDVTSGLAVAQLFDPGTGMLSAVWTRVLQQVGVALLVVGGGIHAVVRTLAGSTRVVPLDGAVRLSDGLAEEAIRQVSALMTAGAELALPVLSALFVVELVLGVASRFAPQSNVLLLGLPVKILVTVAVAGAVLLTMPAAMRDLTQSMGATGVDVLRGMR